MKGGQNILAVFNAGVRNESDHGIDFRTALGPKLSGDFLFDFNIPDCSLIPMGPFWTIR